MEESVKLGIKEKDFWDMTIGEIARECKGILYRIENDRKERSQFDYTLANLIILGVSRCLGGHNDFPSLHAAYPGLYKEEVVVDKTQSSVANFMAFAQRHNRKVSEHGPNTKCEDSNTE